MHLSETLIRILKEYSSEKATDFSGNELATFIRHSATEQIAHAVGEKYLVKGSAGQSDWAETPWIAIMDPLVTASTQRGFYVVYLFNLENDNVYLSLNQGVTAVKEEFGSGSVQKDILKARSVIMRERLRLTEQMPKNDIVLSEATDLSKSYQWGHVSGYQYNLNQLPDEAELMQDLDTALKAYAELVELNGYILDEEDTTTSHKADERRRYRLHKRIERKTADPKKIKKLKGFDCEACGFNFEEKYGELGKEFIEAHHLVPIGTLEVGKIRNVDLVSEFAVLCANCHRMAHRLTNPSDINSLKSKLR
ncbi:MAG: MrcB family domain-containing protein [Alphaproteobacteria bacterium]